MAVIFLLITSTISIPAISQGKNQSLDYEDENLFAASEDFLGENPSMFEENDKIELTSEQVSVVESVASELEGQDKELFTEILNEITIEDNIIDVDRANEIVWELYDDLELYDEAEVVTEFREATDEEISSSTNQANVLTSGGNTYTPLNRDWGDDFNEAERDSDSWGVAEATGAANEYSGAVGAFSKAWGGSSEAEGMQYATFYADSEETPTTINIDASMYIFEGITDFAAAAAWSHQRTFDSNDYEDHTMTSPWEWDNIVSKIIYFVGLATPFAPSSLAEAIYYLNLAVDYGEIIDLALTEEFIEYEPISLDVEISESGYYTVGFGVKAESIGAIVGSAFSALQGNVNNIIVGDHNPPEIDGYSDSSSNHVLTLDHMECRLRNVYPIDHYRVEWMPHGGEYEELGTVSPGDDDEEIEFTHTNPPDTANYYRVFSVIDGDDSSPSNTVVLGSSNGGGGCPYVSPWTGEEYKRENNLLIDSEYKEGTVEDYYILENELEPRGDSYQFKIEEFKNTENYFDQVGLYTIDYPSEYDMATTSDHELILYEELVTLLSSTESDNQAGLEDLNTALDKINDDEVFQREDSEDEYLIIRPHLYESYETLDEYSLENNNDYGLNVPPVIKSGLTMTYDGTEIDTFEGAELYPRNHPSDLVIPTGDIDDLENLEFTADEDIEVYFESVKLAESVDEEILIQEANLDRAVFNDVKDVTEELSETSTEKIRQVPGDEIHLTFAKPRSPSMENIERSFMIVSKGRYEVYEKESSYAPLSLEEYLEEKYPTYEEIKVEEMPESEDDLLEILQDNGLEYLVENEAVDIIEADEGWWITIEGEKEYWIYEAEEQLEIYALEESAER